MKPLVEHLLGETRTAVLAALLLHPEERQHVRALARTTGVSPGTLHRELTALARFGVLTRSAVGRQVFYAANRDCPVFEELAGLLRKTAGSVDVVRQALEPCMQRIDSAFVYGSVASGEEGPHSDLDVMILGNLGFAEAVRALAPAQDALRREVNATVMKSSEFVRKRMSNDPFVSAVWKSPKLWIKGSEDELGEPGPDRSN